MGLDQKIKKVKEALEPYYSLLGMIIFFVVSFLGVYKFVVRPPDLGVDIKREEVNFPNKINNEFSKVYKYLSDSSKNQGVISSAANVYLYLTNTDNFWSLTLTNETDKAIEKIRFRITNVSSLNSWGVSSSFFLDSEQNRIMQNISYQDKSGIIYLDKIDELPAKASLTIYLWGKMPKLSLDDNVFVDYSGGSARPSKQIEVSGFKAYLVDYIYEILFLIFLIFTAVYKHLLKKYRRANT